MGQLVSFFEGIFSFFETLFNLIISLFEMIMSFFQIVFSSLIFPVQFIGSNMFPSILTGFFAFVVAIAIVKIIITHGGYSE